MKTHLVKWDEAYRKKGLVIIDIDNGSGVTVAHLTFTGADIGLLVHKNSDLFTGSYLIAHRRVPLEVEQQRVARPRDAAREGQRRVRQHQVPEGHRSGGLESGQRQSAGNDIRTHDQSHHRCPDQ